MGATVRFASDSKAFWSLPDAQLTVNHAAIDCYLHHLAVTTDHTIYNEVSKLPPSHYLVFERAASGETRSRTVRYWKPNFRDKLPPIRTPIRGLQIADTSYYYPEDRGVAESIRFGRMMAEAA